MAPADQGAQRRDVVEVDCPDAFPVVGHAAPAGASGPDVHPPTHLPAYSADDRTSVRFAHWSAARRPAVSAESRCGSLTLIRTVRRHISPCWSPPAMVMRWTN